MDCKRSSSINPWLIGIVYNNNCLQLTCNKISQNYYFPQFVSLFHSLHQPQDVFPLPLCFIVCCHSCFPQQQYYLFYLFLSLDCNSCSACLFFTFLESLIHFYAFWSFIPDTTGGVSDPYTTWRHGACLYFQFSSLVFSWYQPVPMIARKKRTVTKMSYPGCCQKIHTEP